jgi:hypothetical protein
MIKYAFSEKATGATHKKPEKLGNRAFRGDFPAASAAFFLSPHRATGGRAAFFPGGSGDFTPRRKGRLFSGLKCGT